jgi:hypothetical protein
MLCQAKRKVRTSRLEFEDHYQVDKPPTDMTMKEKRVNRLVQVTVAIHLLGAMIRWLILKHREVDVSRQVY